MSLVIVPKGFSGAGVLEKETLTREECDLVMKFEAWCQKRGIALDLVCRHCFDSGAGLAASRCSGDNSREATVFHIRCGHADRVYGVMLQ